MRVVIGSESRIKVAAVANALMACGVRDAICDGVAAESGVPAQPKGLVEGETGARNRVVHATALKPGADYYVAIENCIVAMNELHCFDVPCVVVRNAAGAEAVVYGTFFPIPQWAVLRVNERGSELGVIVQELAGGGEKDPMVYFSNGTVSRDASRPGSPCPLA